VAALVGTRVGGRTPPTTATPWVRITQIDDEAIDGTSGHAYTVHLQIECYAGDVQPAAAHEQASTLVRTVRAVLRGLPGTHAGGVVTAVRFTSSRRIPDTELSPARERFILGANVTVHP
jgi:hypothetical protein